MPAGYCKMRILYIGTPYSIHDVKWATFFSALEEYEVFFICEKQNIPPGETEAGIKEYYRQLNITFLGSIDSFSISHLLSTISSIVQLKRFIRQNQVELVHILFAAPFALWGLFIPCKYTITTRGSDILIAIPDLKKERGIKGFYFRILFRLFKSSFNKAEKITCTSSTQVERTKQLMHVQKEPVIIRTGVEVDAINSINSNELIDARVKGQKFIFSPRYMKPVYNIALQVEAIEKLNTDILKNYWFVFIRGANYDKKYFGNVAGKLERLKIEKGLKYLVINQMSQQQIWQYYKYASLTVMTPLSDGTPNTALEAMAAKCPLIIPDLPYDAALFNGTCIKLDYYDAGELAKKITLALTNYPKELTGKAFEAVSKFGNRRIEMLKLNELYKEINKG